MNEQSKIFSTLAKIGAWLQLGILVSIIGPLIAGLFLNVSNNQPSEDEISQFISFTSLAVHSLMLGITLPLAGYLFMFVGMFSFRAKWFYRLFLTLNILSLTLSILLTLIILYAIIFSKSAAYLDLMNYIQLIFIFFNLYSLNYLKKHKQEFKQKVISTE